LDYNVEQLSRWVVEQMSSRAADYDVYEYQCWAVVLVALVVN